MQMSVSYQQGGGFSIFAIPDTTHSSILRTVREVSSSLANASGYKWGNAVQQSCVMDTTCDARREDQDGGTTS